MPRERRNVSSRVRLGARRASTGGSGLAVGTFAYTFLSASAALPMPRTWSRLRRVRSIWFLQFWEPVLAEVFVGFVACFAGPADLPHWLADRDAAVPAPEPEDARVSRCEVRVRECLREARNRLVDRRGVVRVCKLV